MSVAPTALASGQLTLKPGSVDFGSVRVGRTSTVTITLSNTGNAAVKVSGDTVTGSGFRASGISVPLNIAAGGSLTFRVSFAPRTTGSSSGQLKLISDAANGTLVLPLAGTGTWRHSSGGGSGASAGYVSATPQTAVFGNVPVGTANTQAIRLTNTGSAGVSISGITATGSGFSASGIALPYSLAAGASAQLTVTFAPTGTGSVTGSVGITSNASDSQMSVAASGTGVAVTRLIGASPGSVAFGNVSVGSTGTIPITLTNSGNSSLTISGASASGAGISDTGVGGGVTLAAGQSTTLTAAFAPKAPGNVTGAITIASNASNSPSLAVPVTGTGVSTASHSVLLQWQASASSGVVGYYVYRGSTASGPYTRLTGSTSSTTSYTDSTVSAGATYYYVVTAVDTDGDESVYSNQAAAAIP